MPTNPTSKSQVQAYRFVLRRMESALVRKDSVMVHEPMRHHLRASAVGLILGVLGLAAFFVIGLFSPTSTLKGNEIVIVKQTGQVFVSQEDPRRLISVPNLASALLLYAAFSDLSEPPETKSVEESALDGIHRVHAPGLEDAPESLPAPDQQVEGDWSVCDTAEIRDELPDAESRPELSTTVVIGMPGPGRPLRENEALLVQDSAGADYLVYGGRRLPVDLSDRAVQLAFELDNVVPRKVSTGLLNAIPAGQALTPPEIPGDDEPFRQLSGVRVGDVVQLSLTDGEQSYYLVLQQGIQPVERAVADLIRFAGGGFHEVRPADLSDVPDAPDAVRRDFTDFPAQVPQVVALTEAPIACVVWLDPAGQPVITVSADSTVPLGEGNKSVPLTGRGNDQSADSVFLEPGKGALVRAVVPGQRPETAPIWLVSDQGVAYSVPTMEVAGALGLGDRPTTAPYSVVELLTFGPELSPQKALARFDPELAQQRAERLDGGG